MARHGRGQARRGQDKATDVVLRHSAHPKLGGRESRRGQARTWKGWARPGRGAGVARQGQDVVSRHSRHPKMGDGESRTRLGKAWRGLDAAR